MLMATFIFHISSVAKTLQPCGIKDGVSASLRSLVRSRYRPQLRFASRIRATEASAVKRRQALMDLRSVYRPLQEQRETLLLLLESAEASGGNGSPQVFLEGRMMRAGFPWRVSPEYSDAEFLNFTSSSFLILIFTPTPSHFLLPLMLLCSHSSVSFHPPLPLHLYLRISSLPPVFIFTLLPPPSSHLYFPLSIPPSPPSPSSLFTNTPVTMPFPSSN